MAVLQVNGSSREAITWRRCFAWGLLHALAAIARAQDNGRGVLVHCHAGSQRTGGVVACYRMLFEGWSFDRALEEMEHYGWRPDRDAVLREYLERHLPEIKAAVQRIRL